MVGTMLTNAPGQNNFRGWVAVDSDPTSQIQAHSGSTSAFRNGSLQALMSWGPVQFAVYPLNYNQMDHDTGTAYARKEIVGAAVYREWVGENDELRHFRGQVFPYRIGGMTALELFDAMRRGGIPNTLMGGDGRNLGWFVCEKFVRNHVEISGEGYGQQINFEAVMARCPTPDPASYVPNILSILQGAGQGSVATAMPGAWPL